MLLEKWQARVLVWFANKREDLQDNLAQLDAQGGLSLRVAFNLLLLLLFLICLVRMLGLA